MLTLRYAAHMLITYDCEFLEDGHTIELISIGIVAEDGREYYAVHDGAIPGRPGRLSWLAQIGDHPWLVENVAPSLPVTVEPVPTRGGGTWNHVTWDKDHRDFVHVKPGKQIAAEVRDFILGDPASDELPYVELWADYAAYDHVALCQLWGRMIDLPEGVPMWTHDLRQEAERLGLAKQLPSLPGVTEHNALSDAREVMFRLKWLREHATAERCTKCGSGSAFWDPQHRQAV